MKDRQNPASFETGLGMARIVDHHVLESGKRQPGKSGKKTNQQGTLRVRCVLSTAFLPSEGEDSGEIQYDAQERNG